VAGFAVTSPAPVAALPPWPPSAVIVTQQIPSGTVAASAVNPGVADENSSTGLAPAPTGADPNARPTADNPTTPADAHTRRIRCLPAHPPNGTDGR
jgi:hypothetical protein